MPLAPLHAWLAALQSLLFGDIENFLVVIEREIEDVAAVLGAIAAAQQQKQAAAEGAAQQAQQQQQQQQQRGQARR